MAGYVIRKYDNKQLIFNGLFRENVKFDIKSIKRTAGRKARRAVTDGAPVTHVLEFRPQEINEYKRILNYFISRAWGPEEIFLDFYNGVRTFYPRETNDLFLGGVTNKRTYSLILEEV